MWTKFVLYFLPFPDIAELRKKFEEDKQRIALLRAQRKFKPYWIKAAFLVLVYVSLNIDQSF